MKSIEYRQLANILALFLIVQLSGLLIAFYLITPSMVVASPQPAGGYEVVYYFLYIILAAVLMTFLFRIYHGNAIFTIIEAIVIASASFYLFLIVLSSALPQSYGDYAVALSVAAAVLLVIAKNKWPGLRNLAAVIASIGVGVVLGSYFGFFAAYAFMAFIAAYDYVAVFVTRHMIALGRESVNRNLAFMIGSYDVEVVPKGYLKGSDLSDAKKTISASKVSNPEIKKLIKSGTYPVPSFSALGTGDLAIPLMLAVSAYSTYFRYFVSLLIVVGAAAGLVFAMYVSKKYKVALPAIPPLFAFISISLLAGFAILGVHDVWVYPLLAAAGAAILALIFFSAKRQSREGDAVRLVRTSA
ncbi:Signal-peptide peptidase, presenilin aspartyl protease [uncultured archaeon]|nr:Signal-peptide peptidase, presenilin aspartyl protease [uncultured archaeon]